MIWSRRVAAARPQLPTARAGVAVAVHLLLPLLLILRSVNLSVRNSGETDERSGKRSGGSMIIALTGESPPRPLYYFSSNQWNRCEVAPHLKLMESRQPVQTIVKQYF
jgi:hypothetical protein